MTTFIVGIVDWSEDAIVRTTRNGIGTSWNAGAVRMFGCSVAEAIGQSIVLIIPVERRNAERQINMPVERASQDRALRDAAHRQEKQLVPISVIVSLRALAKAS
jgi:PAS domain S-box-containing protein